MRTRARRRDAGIGTPSQLETAGFTKALHVETAGCGCAGLRQARCLHTLPARSYSQAAMAHARQRPYLVFVLALSACAGATSDPSSPPPTPAASGEAPSTDEVVVHGVDLELAVNAAGQALVVSGGLGGLTAVSWGPEAGWSAPVELAPAVTTG